MTTTTFDQSAFLAAAGNFVRMVQEAEVKRVPLLQALAELVILAAAAKVAVFAIVSAQ